MAKRQSAANTMAGKTMVANTMGEPDTEQSLLAWSRLDLGRGRHGVHLAGDAVMITVILLLVTVICIVAGTG